jgi:hypothetical protein
MDLKETGLGRGVLIGFDWLRTGTGGGLLWVRWWTFGFLRHGVSSFTHTHKVDVQYLRISVVCRLAQPIKSRMLVFLQRLAWKYSPSPLYSVHERTKISYWPVLHQTSWTCGPPNFSLWPANSFYLIFLNLPNRRSLVFINFPLR